MIKVKAIILTGFGLNCDIETARAFELAGADAYRIHINTLIHGNINLDDFHILTLGGGFSWGDDHGAGTIQALKLKKYIGDKIISFINKGNIVLGICNGFQTLVNMGLIPGINQNYTKREIAITYNDCGNFRDEWVYLKINKDSPCIFTKNIDIIDLPIRHGEGKVIADKSIIEELIKNNQIVLRYADSQGKPADSKFPFNPNGSIYDIAGICDTTGRVLGLMPHPEAYNHFTNHPDWTRTKEEMKRQGIDYRNKQALGIKFFANAVEYIKNS